MIEAIVESYNQLQRATDPWGSMLAVLFNTLALTALFYAAVRLCEQWYDEQVP